MGGAAEARRTGFASDAVAAFVTGLCVTAFVVVSKCLLQQHAEPFPLVLFPVALATGFVAGFFLRHVGLALLLWLGAATALASAWGFRHLPEDGLRFAGVPFLLVAGVALGALARRRSALLVFPALAAAAAWLLAEHWLPHLGYTATVYAVAGLMGIAFLVVAVVRRARVSAMLAGIGVLAVAGFVAPHNLSRVTVPEGWRLFGRREGLQGSVMLIERMTAPGRPLLQRLILDNRHIIGGQLGFGEKRLGHLPLLLKPDAKSVLFLHANAGVAVGAAIPHVGIERIDCVEPLPEVAAFLPQFMTSNDRIYEEARAKFIGREVRDFLAGAAETYDVIVANPMPPSREGTGKLFTTEFYRDVRGRLVPGGVFVQWLPLFELDEPNLKTIVRTFAASFPDAQGFIGIYNGELPVFGLFARAAGGNPPAASAIQKRLDQNLAARAFVADVRDLLASRLLDTPALAAFAGEGTVHAVAQPALHFTRAFCRQPQDARRGGELLSSLLALAATNAPLAVLADPGEEVVAAALRQAVATRIATMRHYLTADILRASGDASAEAKMAAEYLLAYESEPDLPVVHAMLQVQAMQKPRVGLQIVRGMLKRTPDDKAAQAMMCTVQERSAQTIGVPLPPSSCGPGTLPPAPAPTGRKIPAPPLPPAMPQRKVAPPAGVTPTNAPAPARPPPVVTF